MFLQLLVAQLQNQSPLDPMDPTQFVGQLAQFSELSEVTQIEQILRQALPTASGSTGTSSAKGHMSVNSPTAISVAGAKAQAATQNANPGLHTIPNHQIQGVF
jgi:flagellar basal-body rod modification protein FlgD